MDQCSSWQWTKLKGLGSDKYRSLHMCPKPIRLAGPDVSGFVNLAVGIISALFIYRCLGIMNCAHVSYLLICVH